MKQQQAIITRVGAPEVLQVVERDMPQPKKGQVRVKVLAAGVAFADVLMRYGKYPGTPPIPFTPGYDIVGVVDTCGTGVSTVQVGQTVAALTQFGGYAQYVCLPEQELLPIASGLDPAEAVSVPLNYGTAYQMLHRNAQIKAGGRILVHGAAGGVGTALLQLGKLAGLEMYGTASKPKHKLVTGLGGTPIDYKNEDFVARVNELTGDGVDAVFDPVGGRNFNRSFQVLRRGGRLVAYGFSSMLDPNGDSPLKLAKSLFDLSFWSLLPNGKKASFYMITRFKEQHPDWFRDDLITLFTLLQSKKIKPLVGARLPLSKAAQAHELIESARLTGKIVLLPQG
ncbi:MAG: Quinone oxidoreductase [Chloroflexi bacterium AL-W]|nr:Quinone oxidoreductase [Chloroflexi bacterium AL-N5]NOK79560.1 Quinone oxidoreductase [Chloroflexi bacterium AL-W]NOK87476.1 Quinone oxidoreductase [Chloroflexi bacterium AL-N15]